MILSIVFTRDLLKQSLFPLLDLHSLCRVSQVCKEWDHLCSSRDIWQPIFDEILKEITKDRRISVETITSILPFIQKGKWPVYNKEKIYKLLTSYVWLKLKKKLYCMLPIIV